MVLSRWRDVHLCLGTGCTDWNCGWFNLKLLATPLISFPGTRQHLVPRQRQHPASVLVVAVVFCVPRCVYQEVEKAVIS